MDPYLDPWDAGIRDAWIVSLQSFADVIGWAMLTALIILLPMAVLLTPRRQRRRIVCPLKGHAMRVQLDACGIPGLLWSATVRSCSAFDPPTAVACDGACLCGWAGKGAGVGRQVPPAEGRVG